MYSGVDKAIIEEQVIDKPSVHIVYPQVRGLRKEVEEQVNQAIRETVERLTIMQDWYKNETYSLDVSFEVTLNEKGLLSLRLENFIQVEHAAHPTTVVASLTVDLNSGKEYELYDYFRNMSGHALRITNYILREVERKGITLIVDLKLIPDNHPYYLSKDGLVIYFQEAEIAPRVYGILEFTISYSFLEPILEEGSPLERLI